MSQKNKTPIRISSSSDMDFLRQPEFHGERDLYNIAYAVFQAEKAIKSNKCNSKIPIYVSMSTYSSLQPKEELCSILDDLFARAFYIDVRFELIPSDIRYRKRARDFNFIKSETVSLFSGGVDSLACILQAASTENVGGVFVAHSDQKGTVNIVDRIIRDILVPKNIPCKKLYAPAISRGGYSQTRGFLYLLSAAIYANVLKSNRILVGECGPTMYQPQFGPFDSITMTSHPIILKASENVIRLVLGKKMSVFTPFEDLTKAEVIATLPHKNLLAQSHSCISQQFRRHDGTCYGCVIRRLGGIVAGHEDAPYTKDILYDSSVVSGNLLSLMRFCHDVIYDKSTIQDFSLTDINTYQKFDLFERFSLDTFSALMLAKKQKNRLSKNIEKAYLSLFDPSDEERLQERIHFVRSKKKMGNFSKGLD